MLIYTYLNYKQDVTIFSGPHHRTDFLQEVNNNNNITLAPFYGWNTNVDNLWSE